MEPAAKPPEITVIDAFGDRLRLHLDFLANTLSAHAGYLERRYLARLRALAYDPRERKALAAVTPGAAACVAAAGRLPPDFVEQVEYNGRRLAKLNVPSGRILQAFQEYDRLLEDLAGAMPLARRDRLQRALEQWYFCVVLTLNHAFQQVAGSEAQTCHELFRTELESAGLAELLGRLLQALVHFCHAEGGALYLRESNGRWTRRAAAGSREERYAARRFAGRRDRLSLPRCAVASRSRPLGLALDPAWRGRYRTCWSVPLVLRSEIVGVIQFGFRRPYEWLPREKDVLMLAAERCVLAAEKARLTEGLAAREAQVRELANRLSQVEEKERRRISSELHDEAGQSLLCVRLQLEMLERQTPNSCQDLRGGLADVRALTEKTILEIRRLVSALSPAILDQLGLAAALRQLAGRVRRLRGLRVALQLGPLREISTTVATAAYRLVQECLNNAVRHSGAAFINISAAMADGELRICVSDNGIGFRVEQGMTKPGSFGLAGMGQRVALLGGEFHVTSRPGRGTKIAIRLPANTEKGEHAREVE